MAALRISASCGTAARCSTSSAPVTSRPCIRPMHVVSRAPCPSTAPAAARGDVRAHFFNKFRQSGQAAGIYASQGSRDDYDKDDVEHYFNYMGMLAVEGTYDRMEGMVNSGIAPVDVLLLMAAKENDTPKVEELLLAGADATVTDTEGKTPSQLATKPEVLQLLQNASK